MNNTERIAEIRERCAAATPGPWYCHETHNWHKDPPKEYHLITRGMREIVASWLEKADAEFAAHAREDIPYLLSEVESLTAELEQKTRELERYRELDNWPQWKIDAYDALFTIPAASKEKLTREAALSTEGVSE